MSEIPSPSFQLLTIPWSVVAEETEATAFLRKPCRQVTSLEDARLTIYGMKKWCEHHASGILGISAPQLGSSLRISFVWEAGLQRVLINPDVVYQKGCVSGLEGCLSLPGRQFPVERPKIVKIRYRDENWQLRSLKGHDRTARIIMHELDHLDGILIDQRRSLKVTQDKGV